MKRARSVPQSRVSEERLNDGSRRTRKAETGPRDSFRARDKIRQSGAAAQRTATAGPMRAHQPQEVPAADPATRHPDLNAEPGWSRISGARPEKVENQPPGRYASFPQLLCN